MTVSSSPYTFSKRPRLLAVLDWITGLLFLAGVLMVFFYAPLEAVMGAVQKVFYFHVAAGWVGMLGFLVAAGCGVAYLVSQHRRWDVIAVAGVELGMVFTLINIVTGSIWARPIWNTWWTWDPRLTTATIMELVYAAYLMLRQGIEEPERRARFGAVYAIVGFLSVPLTFFSIRIFRTIHPVVIGSGDPSASGSFDMTPKMLQTFLFGLLVFSVLFVDWIWHRIRLGQMAEQVEALRLLASEGSGSRSAPAGLALGGLWLSLAHRLGQERPPDTLGYMIAGYAVIFGIMAIYLATMVVRYRNLKLDLKMLEEIRRGG